MSRYLLWCSLLFLTLTQSANAWWQEEWNFRKKVSLDTSLTGANLTESLTEFTLLVRLHSGNFGYFLDLNPDGSDLRFVAADDRTPLSFHIEKFDPINEMALIWVKVPQLTSGVDTESIWMYYGNQGAVAASDSAASFDIHEALVYHYDNVNGSVRDQSAYANHAQMADAAASTVSLIGNGAQFDGAQKIQVAATPSSQIQPETGWSWSSWVKIDEIHEGTLMSAGTADENLQIRVTQDKFYIVSHSAQGESLSAPASIPLTQWVHVALLVSQDTTSLLLNGQVMATLNIASAPASTGLVLGNNWRGNRGLKGLLDETRVSKTLRTESWYKAHLATTGMDANLIKFGEDESNAEAGGHSDFVVILQNVTVDGWVVIALLIVMLVISFVVMAVKALDIGRIAKSNAQFLDKFSLLSLEDLLTIRTDDLSDSPLASLYETGQKEIKLRLRKTVGAQAMPISASAFEAVRAAMDANYIRESQRLNSMMVLLTIAISGGPFLGLLGTVVGVMITFAAIAATGDVNIAAIAPGMAAALLATVAGLAVAIPALFGYNYLGSRIKEILADMQVFNDEFVTKAAELYGE
ncbi:MAG TPA: DUF2341 domain-containing protein [Gammaproteobacteria bacterium]|nr:DUF2341 domain-containing protein [Gammaproteobacteria bacterium]